MERRNYERDIIDMCINEAKLFFRHINGKMKKKEGVSRLKLEGKIYEDAQDMAEVMNNSFRSVFTVEGELNAGRDKLVRNILNTVPVICEEILKMMEEIDVNKASGPDGVSYWKLKECREQLADKIHSMVVTSLLQGRVPKD